MKENRLILFLKQNTVLRHMLFALAAGILTGLCMNGIGSLKSSYRLSEIFASGLLLGGVFFYPVILTGYTLLCVWRTCRDRACVGHPLYDMWILGSAILYETIYLLLVKEVYFTADFDVQLINQERHTPLYTGAFPTVLTWAGIFLISLCILSFRKIQTLPPLAAVLCISGMYAGLILLWIFTVQIIDFDSRPDLCLLLPAVCGSAVSAKVIIARMFEYSPDPNRMSKIEGNRLLSFFDRLLKASKWWPVYAFLCLLPLLLAVTMVLVLFGQAPDSLIRAFTGTSDWTFSGQSAPVNLQVDEHYLCTVAAGGHRRIVKPIRRGIRHGHTVIVNRQLLTANAFEQILEEKCPRIHFFIRSRYDRYGFPLAKLIRVKWAADAVYLLMKLPEYLFLAVIYLCDRYPEDRIAIQYTGRRKEEFQGKNCTKKKHCISPEKTL